MPPRTGGARQLLRRLAAFLITLLAVVAAALAIFLHDLDRKVRTALVERAAEIEALLGRRLTIGPVHVALGGVTEIVARDIVLEAPAGASGELAVPALRVHEIRLAVALSPLVRSRGRAIEVTRLEVRGPELTLVRTPEGLSIDDLRARIAAAPKRPPPKEKVALKHLAITGGKLRVHDLGADARDDLVIAELTAAGRDVSLSAPSRLELGAALFGSTRNLEAQLDLVPTAASPTLELARAELRATHVSLGPALRFARVAKSSFLDLDAADLDARVKVDAAPTINVDGRVSASNVRLAGGAPSALVLDTQLAIDPAAGTVAARSFELAASGVSAHGSLGLSRLGGAPALDALDLTIGGDADAVRALVPPDRLPAGVAFRGPVTLSLHAAGALDDARASVKLALGDVRAVAADRAGHPSEGRAVAVSLGADLAFSREKKSLRIADATLAAGDLAVRGDADLRDLGAGTTRIEALSLDARAPGEALLDLLPPPRRPPGVTLRGPLQAKLALHGKPGDLEGSVSLDLRAALVAARDFVKPAGVPLVLSAEGRAAEGRVDIAHAELFASTLAIAAHGSARSAEQIEIAFEPVRGHHARLAPLLALFPAASAKLGANTVIDGDLAASGQVKRSGGATTLDLTVGLRDARLRQGLVALSGAIDLTTHAELTAGAASVRADLELGGAAIDVPPAVDKPKGKPARVSLSLTREGDRVEITGASVALPGVSLDEIRAEIDAERVHLAIPTASLSLARLAEILPLAGGRLPPALADATLRFGLDLDGARADMGAAKLRLASIDFSAALGHLTGALEIDGLRPARAVRLEVRGGTLDLTGGGGPEMGALALPVDPPGDVRVEARVHLDSAKLPGETTGAIDAELVAEKGRITLRSARAAALGGTFQLDPSYLDLSDVPELDVHAKAEGIDLSRFASERVEGLRGHAAASLDLHTRGLDRDHLLRALRGSVRVELTDVHGKSHVHPKITIVNKPLAAFAKRAEEKRKDKPRILDLRRAVIVLDVGADKLATRGPVLVESPDFTARITGTIGKDGALALDGKIEIPPHVIAEGTERKLVPVGPIPLKLRVAGDTKAPTLELLELGETIAAFRGAIRNAVDNAAMPVP
jgi:uncharacterized protein involved in outer membrane biogenesis